MNAEILADVLNRTSPKHYYPVIAAVEYAYWYRDGGKSLVIVCHDGASVICRNNSWTVQR